MKQWYKIAFNARLDESDIRAMKKCFYDVMEESMDINECAGLKVDGEAGEWCTITFSAKLNESDLRAMKSYFYQAMEEAMDIGECADLNISEEEDELSGNETDELRREAYRRYQLDWMMRQGYSVEDLAGHIVAQVKEMDLEEILEDNGEIFSQWEGDVGFNGSLYVCFDEFLGAEYRDPDYMKHLLPEELFALWMQLESDEDE